MDTATKKGGGGGDKYFNGGRKKNRHVSGHSDCMQVSFYMYTKMFLEQERTETEDDERKQIWSRKKKYKYFFKKFLTVILLNTHYRCIFFHFRTF